ncbi:hypothetical protein [Sphingomonas jatrophae]|nr:hypothetical protein [Sphingomonas jatrophae]
MAQEEVHLNQDRARAGATPKMTRYILGISLPLIVIAFLIILFVYR